MPRTTVEIPTRELTELRALAARRGMRGFSELVAEAVREYLEGKGEREREEKRRLKTIRRLRGALSDEAAKRMRAIVKADREEKA